MVASGWRLTSGFVFHRQDPLLPRLGSKSQRMTLNSGFSTQPSLLLCAVRYVSTSVLQVCRVPLYPPSHPLAYAKPLPLPGFLCSGATCQASCLPGGTTPHQALPARVVTAPCPLLAARNS